MGLTKRNLKGLIEYSDLRNEDGLYTEDDVIGVSTDKCMIPTKANLDGVNLHNYKLFSPGCFAFVADTARRSDKIALAYNSTEKTFIVSTWYAVFKVCNEAKSLISPDYLFMYLNRAEFDRYTRANSWGSAREYFWFSDMEDVVIELPPFSVQQKYVNVYKAMTANQQSYERGLEDLKLVCDGYIENARRVNEAANGRKFLLGDLIEQRREKYDGSDMPIRGVSRDGFIEPKQPDADLRLYNQYYYNDFVFNPARMELNSIALNKYFEKACCSSLYEVFYVKRLDLIIPEYLNLLLKRPEFARWCEYVGWGSAREYCRVDTISQYLVSVPSMEEQKAVVNIYKAYVVRKEINDRLKAQIKDICPILIRGSLEDGG